MAHRLIVASLVFVPALVAALEACGGSGAGGSSFPNLGDDASVITAPYGNDAGIPLLGVDAAGGDAAGACTPATLTSFTPTWKKPSAAAAGKCTTTQIQGFYADCLLQPLTSSACTSFVAANGDCSTCLQSDDTDPTYSAVIWHSDRAFYTFNTAGCIADLEDDDSPTGCGAAYQAAVQCEETACSACGVADYALFPQCEQAAGSECASYASKLNTACGPGLRDAADPTSVCTLATSAQSAYLAIAPVFCGSPQ